ncbi:MAG: hypothetical protein ACRBM6_00850 [Geminicoccales bacterium]
MEVTPLATSEGFGKLLSLVKGKISGRAEEALVDLERDPASDENQPDFKK